MASKLSNSIPIPLSHIFDISQPHSFTAKLEVDEATYLGKLLIFIIRYWYQTLLISMRSYTSSGERACGGYSGPQIGTDSWQVYSSLLYTNFDYNEPSFCFNSLFLHPFSIGTSACRDSTSVIGDRSWWVREPFLFFIVTLTLTACWTILRFTTIILQLTLHSFSLDYRSCNDSISDIGNGSWWVKKASCFSSSYTLNFTHFNTV